jgi:hypothetical protein
MIITNKAIPIHKMILFIRARLDDVGVGLYDTREDGPVDGPGDGPGDGPRDGPGDGPEDADPINDLTSSPGDKTIDDCNGVASDEEEESNDMGRTYDPGEYAGDGLGTRFSGIGFNR